MKNLIIAIAIDWLVALAITAPLVWLSACGAGVDCKDPANASTAECSSPATTNPSSQSGHRSASSQRAAALRTSVARTIASAMTRARSGEGQTMS